MIFEHKIVFFCLSLGAFSRCHNVKHVPGEIESVLCRNENQRSELFRISLAQISITFQSPVLVLSVHRAMDRKLRNDYW